MFCQTTTMNKIYLKIKIKIKIINNNILIVQNKHKHNLISVNKIRIYIEIIKSVLIK